MNFWTSIQPTYLILDKGLQIHNIKYQKNLLPSFQLVMQTVTATLRAKSQTLNYLIRNLLILEFFK